MAGAAAASAMARIYTPHYSPAAGRGRREDVLGPHMYKGPRFSGDRGAEFTQSLINGTN